tara:strand:+ start:256 stop:633 length:378 start_codon:yes stop_codon:yes gene_type:complete
LGGWAFGAACYNQTPQHELNVDLSSLALITAPTSLSLGSGFALRFGLGFGFSLGLAHHHLVTGHYNSPVLAPTFTRCGLRLFAKIAVVKQSLATGRMALAAMQVSVRHFVRRAFMNFAFFCVMLY